MFVWQNATCFDKAVLRSSDIKYLIHIKTDPKEDWSKKGLNP
jgi:hypothetical protein